MFYPKLEQPCDAQQPCVFRGSNHPDPSVLWFDWFLRWPSWIGKAKTRGLGLGKAVEAVGFCCFGTRGVGSDVCVFFLSVKWSVCHFWFLVRKYIFRKTHEKTKRVTCQIFLLLFAVGQENFSIGKTPLEAQLLKQHWIVGPALVLLTIAILPHFQEISNRDPRSTDPEKTGVSNSSIATYLGVHW